MRKYMLRFAAFLLITVILCGCAKGKVDNVYKVIGDSDVYSAYEIEKAMNIVISQFRKGFTGCTLTEIAYNEESSEKASAQWADQYGADEAIVLVSSFEVDASGGEGNLQPNSTYDGFAWVLTRSNGGRWTLRTWGYG